MSSFSLFSFCSLFSVWIHILWRISLPLHPLYLKLLQLLLAQSWALLLIPLPPICFFVCISHYLVCWLMRCNQSLVFFTYYASFSCTLLSSVFLAFSVINASCGFSFFFLHTWFHYSLSFSTPIFISRSLTIMDFFLWHHSVHSSQRAHCRHALCKRLEIDFWRRTRAQASIKQEQDPSLTWNLRKLMSSGPGGSEDKLRNPLATIAEYFVCGALCASLRGCTLHKGGAEQGCICFIAWQHGSIAGNSVFHIPMENCKIKHVWDTERHCVYVGVCTHTTLLIWFLN